MCRFIDKHLARDCTSICFEPHFLYDDMIYDGCSKSLKQLQIHQNMALWAVLDVDRDYSTRKLLEKVDTVHLETSRRKHCCSFAYKVINKMQPPRINALFPTPENMHVLQSSKSVTFIPPIHKLQTKINLQDATAIGHQFQILFALWIQY